MTLAPAGSSGATPEGDEVDGGPGGADVGGSGDGTGVQRVRRRREVLRRRRRTRRAVIAQSVATVVFVALLVGLVYVGWSSTMRITGGRLDAVTDPEAPGYVAAVRPTSVTLVAFTEPLEASEGPVGTDTGAPAGDEAAGSPGPDDPPAPDDAEDTTGDDPVDVPVDGAPEGDGAPAGDGTTLAAALLVIEGTDLTSVVPISPDILLWDFEGATADSARSIFASGGAEVLRLRLGADATFGATSMLTLPVAVLEELAAQVGGVSFALPDDVLEPTPDGPGVRWPAGPLKLAPGELGSFLSYSGLNEQELNRSLRIELLWQALLDAGDGLAGGFTVGAVDDEADEFAELLGTIADKGADLDLMPLEPLPVGGEPPVTLYRIDTSAMPAWVSGHVPFPVSAFPGQRARVRLLNGTTDAGAPTAVAPAVVVAMGEVVQTGNAESFDVGSSRVEYGSQEGRTAAERIAAELGTSAEPNDELPADVDVVVVVGSDLLGAVPG